MAIPDKALQINFDPNEVTLDELCLFEAEGFTAVGFRRFLVEHTNWTKKEIGALKLSELKQVAEQISEQFKAAAVPLAS